MLLRQLTLAIFLLVLLSNHIVLAESADRSLSPSVYNRLAAIEKLMGEQDYEKAQSQLSKMLNKLPKKATDQAYVYHTQATLHLYQTQYKEAQEFYTRAYDLDALQVKTQAQVSLTLANLAMHFDQLELAVTYYQQHLTLEESAKRDAYFALGSALYQLKRYSEATEPLEYAKSAFEPHKSVYLLLYSTYYEQEKLEKSAEVLESVIRYWPEETSYWLQLASIYLELKKSTKSLEVLQLAFSQGLILKENELTQFIYTLYEEGLPYKAGKVLSQAIEQGSVMGNYKHYSLLASLWTEARENANALEAFKHASKFSDNGKEALYLAQLYFDQDAYNDSIEYATTALNKGVKNPGNAHMLIAAAYHEIENTTEVKKHLQIATQYKETKKIAEEWMSSLN